MLREAILQYTTIIKPMSAIGAMQWVYASGVINSMEDMASGKKKPVYVNVYQIAKSATVGALIGATFPISIPIMIAYLSRREKKL